MEHNPSSDLHPHPHEPITLSRSDLTKLEETVNTVDHLRRTIVDLQNQMLRYEATLADLPSYEEFVRLQQKLQSLETSLKQPSASITLPANEPDIADAEFFSGERHKLSNFLSQCRLKFWGQSSRFRTESSKIMYAGSRLRGVAYSWFEPILDSRNNNPLPELQSFERFTESLTAMYGITDQKATAERQITECHQVSSAAAYAAEFRRLQGLISWNDSALCHQFYTGLKENVKDKLAETERPATLTELIASAVRIDNRFHERRLEKSTRSPAFSPSRPIPTTNSPVAHPTPNSGWKPSAFVPQPMDLDSTRPRFRKLTDEEKQRRRSNNLCMYCGKAGHSATECPSVPKINSPPSNRSNISAMTNAPYERSFTIQAPGEENASENFNSEE